MPRYSPALVNLIRSMFTVDPVKRPTVTDAVACISEILRAPAFVPYVSALDFFNSTKCAENVCVFHSSNEPDAVVSPNLSQAKAKQSTKVAQRTVLMYL
jgi:hypothetical protein